MDDLVQFLRARLDDDAATARAADPGLNYLIGAVEYAYDKVELDQRHALRHSPARVLAEVDAKRQILVEHQPWRPRWCSTCDLPGDQQGRKHGCTTVRLLALSYADHPDYRDEWRP